eukprot:1194358-Amphidinium_carterae.1
MCQSNCQSNTCVALRAKGACDRRHMTEFTGLDLEMTFMDHYSEVSATHSPLLPSLGRARACSYGPFP